MTTVLLAGLGSVGELYGQEKPPTATPAPPPEPDVLHREELTGDWGGVRTRWKDKGFELESSVTQFYQGVASGGTGTSSEYTGNAMATLKLDLTKLAGWQYWLAEQG